MKGRVHTLITCAGLFVAACTRPLGPPTSAAPSVPTPSLSVDGDTTEATVNGLTIIVRRLPAGELNTASLYVKGGARNWNRANAGIERLAFGVAISAGPAGMTKASYKRRQLALGAQVGMATSRDVTVLQARGLASTWPQTLDLLLDVFLDPALPEDEINIRRTQLLTELEQEGDDPVAQLRILGSGMVFKDHLFEPGITGTPDTLNRLQRKDLVHHLGSLRETHRLLLVVAGDVDPRQVIAQATRRLGTLPPGRFVDEPLPPLRFTQANLKLQARALPTNHLTSHFAGPRWTDPLFPASFVAIDLLSARLFREVRIKRGLSYAPYAAMANDSYLPIGVLALTTAEPTAAMKVMLDETRRLQSQPVTHEELEETKAVFLTRYLSLMSTSDGIVTVVGNAQLYAGDWRFARRLPQMLRAVAASEVQDFARKYLVNLQTVVLGELSKVDSAVFLAPSATNQSEGAGPHRRPPGGSARTPSRPNP